MLGREAARCQGRSANSISAARLSTLGYRVEQLDLTGERARELLDPFGECRDRLVEKVDLQLPDEQRVVFGESGLRAPRAARDLLASAPLASSASNCGSWVPEIIASSISRADLPSTSEGDRGQLDPGVLQRLLDALHLPSAFLDLRFAVADQVTQLPQRARRHEARADEAALDQLTAPLGVLNIALAPGDDANRRR